MAELSLPFESRYFPLKRFFDIYHRSMEEPEEFWAEQAHHLDWPYQKTSPSLKYAEIISWSRRIVKVDICLAVG